MSIPTDRTACSYHFAVLQTPSDLTQTLRVVYHHARQRQVFGWRKSDTIHYYSEMLGMKYTISEEDMFVDTSRTEVEQQLVSTRQENDMLREHIVSHNDQVRELKALMQVYLDKLKQVESMRRVSPAA